MDTQRLERAIGAASFAADLEHLPNGITSEIIEHGANLPGGPESPSLLGPCRLRRRPTQQDPSGILTVAPIRSTPEHPHD